MPTDRDNFSKIFWENVKEQIKKSEYTQKTLSVAMGYNEQFIESYIRRKAVPDVYYAYQMASLLGTTIDSLLNIEHDDNKTKALELLRQAETLLS